MLLWGGGAVLCVLVVFLNFRASAGVVWWAFFGLIPILAGALVAFMGFVVSGPPPATPSESAGLDAHKPAPRPPI